ncbi:MAG: YfdX family protein, partial [Deltaproteobacteria bacterium]|nr:YfdX family protein [Deltaproteobacteria bacterium]
MELKKRIITTAIAVVFLSCSVGYAETIKQTYQTNTIKKAQQSDAEKKALKEAAKDGKNRANKLAKIVNKDVVEGLKDVKEAINFLAKEKPEVEKAIKHLQSATGEFEVAVSLDKDLAFAPVGYSIETYILEASSDEVKRELAFIKDLIKSGKVQDARRLLMPLRSEVVVHTTSLPTITYPKAIKDAIRLLSDGTGGKAKELLETAMDTLVVDDEIIPIPV